MNWYMTGACMRSILTAVNTITTATIALVEESLGASKDELQDVQEQLGPRTTAYRATANIKPGHQATVRKGNGVSTTLQG